MLVSEFFAWIQNNDCCQTEGFSVNEETVTLAEIFSRQLVPAEVGANFFRQNAYFPLINIDSIPDEDFILTVLPKEILIKYQLLLYKNIQNELSILIGNPLQPQICQHITVLIGQAVHWHIIDADKLARKFDQLFPVCVSNFLENPDATVNYVSTLFTEALKQAVSDIHIEMSAKALHIRWRIDGLLYEYARLPIEWAPQLLAHIKILAQLDITEKRLPQDGRLQISLPSGKPVDCRLSTCPMVHGEKAVLRLLNTHHVPLDIEQLGLHTSQREIFLHTLRQPQGMVLVTGPTGSGKTVTLYTALQLLNQPQINISSVEDPVEIELIGINQVAVNPKIDLTFARVLRALLRQDPDIMMVGEIRDAETASIALQAAQTGHLVLSTLHTNTAAETLIRLLHMGIAAYQVVASISLIIAQRLVRVLCPHCKTLDAVATQAFSCPIYQAVGCIQCQQGYRGRTAIYEFLKMTPTVTECMLQQPNVALLERQALAEGMLTLAAHGWQKIRAGFTTPAELARVIQHNIQEGLSC